MATSIARVYLNGCNYEIAYDLVDKNIGNNTSTIRVYGILHVTNNYVSWSSGTARVWDQTNGLAARYNKGDHWVVQKDVVISHNDDGTKKGVYVDGSLNTTFVSGNVSGYIDLPTIPRASSITATDAYVESATSINISRATSSFKHKITYSFEGLTGTVAENVDTSFGWTIPKSFYDKLTTKSSATCTLTCQTYNGSTLIGSKTTTFKISVDSEKNKPTITATVVDENTTTVNLTGSNAKLVKYYSNAKVTMTATAKNGATIKSKKITCGDGKSLTDSGTINKVESGKFTISATDSRNISNTITKTLTIVDYIKLTLNANFYRSQPTNNEIVLEYSGNLFNKTFGSVTNTLSLKYRYRKHGASTWSSYVNLTPTKSGNTYSNGTLAVSLGTNFDYREEYDFQIVVADKLMTITKSQTVAIGIPVCDWGKEDFQFNVPVFLKNGNEILEYEVVDEWS